MGTIPSDFEKRLQELELSKKDFVNIVGMPYQTLMNWKQKDKTPIWVEPFLHYYQKAKMFDKFLDIVKQYTQELH